MFRPTSSGRETDRPSLAADHVDLDGNTTTLLGSMTLALPAAHPPWEDLLVKEKELTRACVVCSSAQTRLRTCPPERPGHDARVRFAAPPGRDSEPEGANGLAEDPLVCDHRRPHLPINSRGDEAMASTWANLDITDLGRQEEWEDSPEGNPQTPPYGWWNYHDAYGKERARARHEHGNQPARAALPRDFAGSDSGGLHTRT